MKKRPCERGRKSNTKLLSGESQIVGKLIRFYWMRILVFIALFLPAFAAAQNAAIKIEIREDLGSKVRVNGRVPYPKTRNLSFVRSVGGFDKLGERVSEMTLKDISGKAVGYQMPIPGEFVADADISEFGYLVDITPRKEQNAAAHTSWLANGVGALMLDDLLPRIGSADRIPVDLTVIVPEGWTTNAPTERNKITNVEDAMYIVGKDIRRRTLSTGNSLIDIVKSGDWQFTDKDLDDALAGIFGEYKRVFSTAPQEFTITVLKFPNAVQPGQWQAETRGRNITIISSDMAFRTQSVQRLHEQLRHEMFHLWIPNGVNLSGNYDWFYEGFAMYQSLKTAVALNWIRFEDFLDTLSRAQAIDARQTNRLSLIDASNKRSNGADTYIYARGMVTAFLCDLLLLHNSKGKHSVNDLLREFYEEHKYPGKRIDGNSAAVEILKKNFEIRPIVEKYINGSEIFDWQPEIALAGLESKNGLTVLPKLTARQKDLLDRLGYNNWRRSTQVK